MNYTTLATKESITKTIEALGKNGTEACVVENEGEALEMIKKFIPQGVSVMNGSSRTLEEIGFVEYLKSGQHGWNNLHEVIVNEKDPAIQSKLHKQATLSDYYVGSVHALSETGEYVIASNSGSQLPNIVFSSPNLIFVVGAQKIVPTLYDTMKRLEEYVIPLENEHMKQKYGVGTMLSKVVQFRRENPIMGRKVRMILVNKVLGF